MLFLSVFLQIYPVAPSVTVCTHNIDFNATKFRNFSFFFREANCFVFFLRKYLINFTTKILKKIKKFKNKKNNFKKKN